MRCLKVVFFYRGFFCCFYRADIEEGNNPLSQIILTLFSKCVFCNLVCLDKKKKYKMTILLFQSLDKSMLL